MARNPVTTLLVLTALVSLEALALQQKQQQQQVGLKRLDEDNGQHPAPEPYSFSYSAESNGGLSTHQESGDGSGRVTGFYTIQDADGRERRVDYVADENGYRANVRTNEVGTRAQAAADAEYSVQLPSAKQLEAAKISYEQYKYLEEQHQVERERNQQARSRHLSMKPQAQQQAVRYNQLSAQQQPAYSNEQQVGSLGSSVQQSSSAQQSGYAGSNAAFSSSSSSSSNSNFADNQSSSLKGSAIQAGGSVSGDQENYLYENSWRQRAFSAPNVTLLRPGQTSTVADIRQSAVVSEQPSAQLANQQQQQFTSYTAANQAAPVIQYSQAGDGRKSSRLVVSEPTIADNERVQQQVTQEPVWKTLARLGGTTKRPITVLQRQLEQQFMQVATQLTDQDYPRQAQTTAAPQIQVTPEFFSEAPQVVLNKPSEAAQAQFEVANNERFTQSSGYSNVDSNIEQPIASTPERPQIPQMWKGTVNQEVTGSTQQQAQIGQQQQQNNILNEDTQLEDERPDQVVVQAEGGKAYSQAQQQVSALPSLTTTSENLAVATNPTAPSGFVSINLSENEAARYEPTARPSTSVVPPEIVKPVQYEAKQELREEVSIVGEQSPNLQVVQQQQQATKTANFQEQTIPQQVAPLEQPTIQPEPAPARPNSVNQIIESFTRQPTEFTVAQQKSTAEQQQKTTLVEEEPVPVKTRQPLRFTGMIMRSTAAPVAFRQEVTTTTTAAPLVRQQEETATSVGRLSEKYYQPTTTTRQPVSSTEQPVTARAYKESANFGTYGVKGASEVAPSLPGPRRTLARLNVTKEPLVEPQPIRTTTESPQTRQTVPSMTTRSPARSQVEFVRPQKQASYAQQAVTNQSSTEYKQPILRQQPQQSLPTTTTSYQNVAAVQQVDKVRQQQQWKGTKGGAWNGQPKRQFWQSVSAGNGANERSATYQTTNGRLQASQASQISRSASSSYGLDSSSSSGFGSRIGSGSS